MFTKDIPDYAKDFKNEDLFVLGINNEFKYFRDNMDEATRGLFENFRVDKIKKFIKLFLAYQNLGQFKDVSNFEIKSSDIKNLIRIKKNFNDFNTFINYKKTNIMMRRWNHNVILFRGISRFLSAVCRRWFPGQSGDRTCLVLYKRLVMCYARPFQLLLSARTSDIPLTLS